MRWLGGSLLQLTEGSLKVKGDESATMTKLERGIDVTFQEA